MAIFHFPLKHVQELEPCMLEGGERVGFFGQGDQVGFNRNPTGWDYIFDMCKTSGSDRLTTC